MVDWVPILKNYCLILSCVAVVVLVRHFLPLDGVLICCRVISPCWLLLNQNYWEYLRKNRQRAYPDSLSPFS